MKITEAQKRALKAIAFEEYGFNQRTQDVHPLVRQNLLEAGLITGEHGKPRLTDDARDLDFVQDYLIEAKDHRAKTDVEIEAKNKQAQAICNRIEEGLVPFMVGGFFLRVDPEFNGFYVRFSSAPLRYNSDIDAYVEVSVLVDENLKVIEMRGIPDVVLSPVTTRRMDTVEAVVEYQRQVNNAVAAYKHFAEVVSKE